MAESTARIADLLIELGSEELPPKALASLSREFLNGVISGLDKLGFAHGDAEAFASPRRLAVRIAAVAFAQRASEQERRGPAVAAAFDADGNPSKAALGFAASCGVAVEALERLATDKGEWLVHRQIVGGSTLDESLAGVVEASLGALPIPKRMRWGAGTAEFVRPVHWLVMMHSDQVIPGTVLGLTSGNVSRGHRFMSVGDIVIGSVGDYVNTLRDQGFVIVDMAARKAAVRDGVIGIAAEVGGHALVDEDLLDEVTALVEWPVPLIGGFDRRFLELPHEAVISSMQGHQKCFPVVGDDGRLLPHFIAVSNLRSKNPAIVRAGNERVIRPRLTDAEFFWQQDLKVGLDKLGDGLGAMTFQAELGSLADKAARVGELAAGIVEQIGGDATEARRAARLAKADLLSAMVFEFPELQGVMGRYYARAAGEPASVSLAIEEQYLPRFAGDALPTGAIGFALALADRLDTLVGIFAIGQKPTGNKDPFGLRRAALGVLRMLIEGKRDLDLLALIGGSAAVLADKVDASGSVDEVFEYVIDRLKVYYADEGIDADVIDAVMGVRPTRPLDFDLRVRAVQAFRATDAGQTLAAANKRTSNILKKVDFDLADLAVDRGAFVEPAETALANAVDAVRGPVAEAFAAGDYEAGLARLADLREPVDAFFDGVMVMADDDALKRNRLALLMDLSRMFLGAGDFSRLQG
ncbi:MAG: glycine--tRNA ligase subunit beta [Gammaproteobacteria bacterium]|nr:glycine--tRNA ligase subunit beta [Gammaproteobacteria bacterium]